MGKGVVRKRILPFTTVRKGESTQPASSSSAATTWSVLDKIQSDCMNKLLSSSPDSDDDGGFVYNEIGIAKHVRNLRNGTCKMNIKDENGKAIGDVIGVDDSGIVGIALVKVDIATRHMPQKGFSISLENGDDQVDGSELQERAYFFR